MSLSIRQTVCIYFMYTNIRKQLTICIYIIVLFVAVNVLIIINKTQKQTKGSRELSYTRTANSNLAGFKEISFMSVEYFYCQRPSSSVQQQEIMSFHCVV